MSAFVVLQIQAHSFFKAHQMLSIVKLLLLSILLVGCGEQDSGADISNQITPLTDIPATYVGTQQCASCHQKQATLWQGSHHDLAMQPANEKTVLGDFDNASFDYFGTVSSFYKKDDQFFVQTDGPDGKLTDYPIAYTFGVFPLQQYLIKFPKGHYQVLNIAWDTRNEKEGGQRWFHLYPDEPIRHDDELHWTGINQNWNYMCADCHSSNLKKNYDASSNEYRTTWSEMNVSCEACHGPGSTHVQWAQLAEETRRRHPDSDMGLTVQFDERSGIDWHIDKKTGQVVRSNPLNKRVELDVCGRCHARRQAISSDYQPGAPLLDHFRVSLLSQNLYHADGQIDEEVYVYGSFLQSKMYKMGVTCSDCHKPHSLKLRVQGNGLCGQCHSTAKYDSDKHHHHKTEATGGQCVNCHMPAKNYMVVDSRRDHSFRIPRPGLSVTVGTPNACNQCHDDKSAKWALGKVEAWYGEQDPQLYAASFSAANHHQIDAAEELLSVAEDQRNSAIVRGTAFSLLGNGITKRSLPAIKRAVRDTDPLVRMGAISTLDALPPQLRAEIGLPLLSDPLRVIRTEAAQRMGAHPASSHDALKSVLAEYKSTQLFNMDRPESLSNLANLTLQESDHANAERLYKQAIELAPYYVPAYINLADLYRVQEDETRALELLMEALAKNEQSGPLYHALGLAQIRSGMRMQGLSSLRQAYELAPDAARYAYVYAVGLHSEGHVVEALATLKEAHERFENDQDILFMLARIYLERNEREQAMIYGNKLDRLMPGSPPVQALLQEIGD
jgi:tetratricopeptide (TPR) repeat protein